MPGLSVRCSPQSLASGCWRTPKPAAKRHRLSARLTVQAITRREVQTGSIALLCTPATTMGERGNGVQDLYDIESQRVLPSAASPSPPAEEFRNTPPETGVGGDIFSPPEPTLNLVPFRCAKTVHFIRHGEGFHNIGFDGNLDAHLTPFGWSQAHALHDHIQSLQIPLNIQLIVVSPMVRTLETATGVFGSGLPPGTNNIMMTSLEARQQWQTRHAHVGLPAGVPVISHEGCRERVSWSRCDARRPLQETQQQFPGVDFSLIQSEEDTMWPEFNHFDEQGNRVNDGSADFGEPEAHVTQRGIKFLHWLMSRPESRIAVVSHCGWLFHTLSAFSHAGAPVKSPPISSAAPGMHAQSSELDVDFQNCEMRTMVLTDPRSGPDRGDPTWFQGGQNFQQTA